MTPVLSPAQKRALAQLAAGDGGRRVRPNPYQSLSVWRTPAGHTIPAQVMHALQRRRLVLSDGERCRLTPAAQRLLGAV